MLKEDYQNYIPNSDGRVYQMTTQASGYTKIEDKTTYTQEGDNFGANDINATNCKVNATQHIDLLTLGTTWQGLVKGVVTDSASGLTITMAGSNYYVALSGSVNGVYATGTSLLTDTSGSCNLYNGDGESVGVATLTYASGTLSVSIATATSFNLNIVVTGSDTTTTSNGVAQVVSKTGASAIASPIIDLHTNAIPTSVEKTAYGKLTTAFVGNGYYLFFASGSTTTAIELIIKGN